MLDFLSASVAWAQTGDGESAEGVAGILSSPLIMIVLMFVVFYFMLIRPQQKKNKETKNMLASLQKGDEVVTSGGIYGRITGLNDTQVVIEIAPQVRVKIHRPSVVQKVVGVSAEPEKK
jgi:preprotein translocase subunit YajC